MLKRMIKQTIMYAKAAFFSASIALIALMGMLYIRVDPVDALFYMLLIYILVYAGILGLIEDLELRKRPRRQ